jgi:hypothetical protein
MLRSIPLPLVSFALYFACVLSGQGIGVWETSFITISMITGAQLAVSWGDMMLAFGLLMLFFEVLKATRLGAATLSDHLASTFALLLYVITFLLVPSAASSVFLLLMLMTLVDVLAGFSVTLRTAQRDVTVGGV